MLFGNVVPNLMPLPNATGLLLFVKAPHPGAVKTRLGKDIGFEHACQLYRCFGLDLLARLQSLKVPILIFFAPKDEEAMVRDWLDAGQFYPQVGDQLGDRMKNAFLEGFQLGFDHLIILGSDSPDVPLSSVRKGLDAIQQDAIAIGPSHDGGYYTLGLSQTSWCPGVFHQIPWSSARVYSETMIILQSYRHSVEVLPPWDDMDTLADLKQLYQRNLSGNALPNTIAYIQAHLLDKLETK